MTTSIRKYIVAVLVLALLGVSLNGCSQQHNASRRADIPSVRGTWPMYQLNSSHNAVLASPQRGARWSHDVNARVNGGLAVVGGTVYLDTFGGKIIALNAADGSMRWEATSDNIIMSTPIVAEGMVFVGTGHNGSMSDRQSSFVYATVKSGDPNPMWGRPEGDHIVALDAATGEKRWTYKTAGEDMPSPAYTSGRLIFANGDMNAYGLRAHSGEALWQRDVGGISTMSSATLTARAVVVGICSGPNYRGSTVALAADSGKVVWRAPYGDCDSSPTVAGSRVFVSGVDGNDTPFGHGGRGIVAALNESNGHVLWTYRAAGVGPYTKIGSNERAIAGTFADDLYYQAFPTTDELAAFDGRSGAMRWKLRTTAPVKMSAVVANGKLYAGDTAGVLYTVDARSGKLLRTQMFDQPFATSPPVIAGRTMFVVAGTMVYALPL